MNTRKKDVIICLIFALFFAGVFLLCLFLPKPEYSESERRKLALRPELSTDTVLNGRFMSSFETYTQDTFPLRDSFRRLKALTASYIFGRQDNNGIYISDGFAAYIEYPLNLESVDRAAERFRYVYEKYLSDKNRIFLSVIPDKNRFLAGQSGHLAMNYTQMEERIVQKMDFAQYIDISDLLEIGDYYMTDTHWRQERITDVADRLAQGMGVSLSQDYELNTLAGDFYGVYYGQAALPMSPDKLSYLTNKAIDTCTVYDWQNKKEIDVYSMELAMGKDPYEMFLSGSLSLITIENPDAQSERELIIFRDSFASSIAPLLISGYSQITLVDIRYIQPEYLEQFISFEGCDILFLYSTLVLNNSETLK